MKDATDVPLQTAEQAAHTLSAARRLTEYANMNAISDLETAIATAYAAFSGSTANVRINLSGIKAAQYNKRIREKLDTIQKQVEQDQKAAHSVLTARIGKQT